MVGGAVVIAGIGFAGSYAAVRDLAIRKGFGAFAHVFPLGLDAGILVLLALDLLLTWLRMPFPVLRQTAWLLTGATIAFNGAAAWPDPLGVGMHAVIPVLFVVTVEAARHAIGRLANITAGRHMEPIRWIRWLLSPFPTFTLWRRMKLWELRSYDRVLELEQERLVYRARLRSRFGRLWRRKAPVEDQLPLKLTRYGVPLKRGRTLASAPPPTPRDALDTHVADALALTSTANAAPAPSTGEVVSRPSRPVNTGAGQAPAARPASVNPTAEREPGTVNPDAGRRVNPPVHAPANGPVNGSRVNPSRPGVNGAASGANSRMKPFTPTVNGAAVNLVNSVNQQVTSTVNGFTPIAWPREFTREAETVNRQDWSVKHPVHLRVPQPADREPGDVNGAGGTVNPEPDEAVNEDRDGREEESVNDRAVNSRRTARAYAAKKPEPSSVRATLGAPRREAAERAQAAADFHAAKKANPNLTQKDFVKGYGRSQPWMTKALKEEAERQAEAAADG
ncbi:DUF2637 domain-containing protein [Streptomyces nanshensis]|uniref:DUF2637 domain-containing protein n=1 Tax=Streptomyces nanshensis TaxID=518642 RepID=UPI003B8492F7